MSSSEPNKSNMSYEKRLEGLRWNEHLGSLFKEVLATMDDASQEECKSEETERAKSILRDFQASHKKNKSPTVLPISVLRSMAHLVGPARVEEALQKQPLSLSYTLPPQPESNPERERFQQRLERLRLKQEEVKYSKLTHNLGKPVQDDDITTKSMTYAASIGLNMIIAPLSFGCFMYFFAGGLMDYIWPQLVSDERSVRNGPDIRRVIVGVISGVIMLFIEMLLFVIRTHEMDKAMRQKSKQKQESARPFGYYTSRTMKTYKDD